MAGLWRQIAVLSVFLCNPDISLTYPSTAFLRIWRNQIEVSLRSINVTAGSEFKVTCDGSAVHYGIDPHLRWYGPDKHWIAYEGSHNRVHVESSHSRRFLKLHIRRVSAADTGLYYCRGWMGPDNGFDLKNIRLIVEDALPVRQRDHTERDHTEREPEHVTPHHLTPGHVATEHVSQVSHSTRNVYTMTRLRRTTRQPVIVQTTSATGQGRCESPNFRCGTGECVAGESVCDNIPDCKDASDEANCGTGSLCNEGMIACRNGDGCVSTAQICDKVPQCNDGSDEEEEVCNLNG